MTYMSLFTMPSIKKRVPDINRTENVALFVRRAVRVILVVLGCRMVGWVGPAVGPVISMTRVKNLETLSIKVHILLTSERGVDLRK